MADLTAGCREDAAASNLVSTHTNGRDDALTRVLCWSQPRYVPSRSELVVVVGTDGRREIASFRDGTAETWSAAAATLASSRDAGADVDDGDVSPGVVRVSSSPMSGGTANAERSCVAGCRDDAAVSSPMPASVESGIDGRDDALTRVSSRLPARYAVADLPAGCREDAAASNLVLTRTDGRDDAWPRVLCWSQREYVPSGLTSDDSVSVYRH